MTEPGEDSERRKMIIMMTLMIIVMMIMNKAWTVYIKGKRVQSTF